MLKVIVSLKLWLVVKAPPLLKPFPADSVMVLLFGVDPPPLALIVTSFPLLLTVTFVPPLILTVSPLLI